MTTRTAQRIAAAIAADAITKESRTTANWLADQYGLGEQAIELIQSELKKFVVGLEARIGDFTKPTAVDVETLGGSRRHIVDVVGDLVEVAKKVGDL